jgi:hypothetical protein
MNALAATNWADHETTPLSRTMADLTIQMVRRVVVQAPIVALSHETTRMSDGGLVHEVFARTGFWLRSPTKILRIRRPQGPPEAPSTERPSRA